MNVQLPDLCLGMSIDHRLEPFFDTGLTNLDFFVGSKDHAQEIENYGRRFQKNGENISDNQVDFATCLAMLETKGGVVIVLRQPAEHQCYFSDYYQTVKECNTLNAIDEVCKVVTGCDLEKINCFDAFSFHKISINQSLYRYEKKFDEAYDIFLNIIQQKQSDVVFCCYRSPHSIKYKDFQCIGIGHIRDYPATFQGQRYTCVNGFHPSYAFNYFENESSLRSLFIIELTKSFCQANDTWKESWMTSVRNKCAAIVKKISKVRDCSRCIFSSHKLWRLTAEIAPILKMKKISQAGLKANFSVGGLSYIWIG